MNDHLKHTEDEIEEVIIKTLPEFSLSKVHKFLNTAKKHITTSEINDQITNI